MKNFFPFIGTLGASVFCWTAFSVNTALASDEIQGNAAAIHGDVEAAAHDLAASAHHGGEASSAGLPQLDPSTFPSQLFWLGITFAVLYIIFSKKSLPEISNVLENRQNHIQGDLETADKLKSEAEAAQKAYEESLDGARQKATKSLNDVQNKIKAKAEKQNDVFREKTEQSMQDLEKRLIKAKNDAMDDMSMIAAEIASEAAKKIVGIHPDIKQAKDAVKAISSTKAKAA